jgi:hypothetical protein
MLNSEREDRRLLIGFANLKPTEEAELNVIRKHNLEQELLDLSPALCERHHLTDARSRLRFLTDRAQGLWGEIGQQLLIEDLREILFPGDLEIDWKRRKLVYKPQTKIQGAFYYLFQHSNLAKICGNTGCARRFFIGKRPNERYCSDTCFAAAQRAAKRDWWEEHGEEWRAQRRR